MLQIWSKSMIFKRVHETWIIHLNVYPNAADNQGKLFVNFVRLEPRHFDKSITVKRFIPKQH